MNKKQKEVLDQYIAAKQIVKSFTAVEEKLRPEVEKIVRSSGFNEENRRYIDSGIGRIVETDKNISGYDEKAAEEIVSKRKLITPILELILKKGMQLKEIPKEFMKEFDKYFEIGYKYLFSKEDVKTLERNGIFTPKEVESIFPKKVSHAISVSVNKDFNVNKYLK